MNMEDLFGDPRWIREYRVLFYIGIGLVLLGIGLVLPGILMSASLFSVIGVASLYIGIFCAVAGFLGLREERKKAGIKRIKTPEGNLALICGVFSVFLSVFSPIKNAPISISLGIIAIIFAILSVKKGDNMYGKDGGICGAIAIIINIWLILFQILENLSKSLT